MQTKLEILLTLIIRLNQVSLYPCLLAIMNKKLMHILSSITVDQMHFKTINKSKQVSLNLIRPFMESANEISLQINSPKSSQLS